MERWSAFAQITEVVGLLLITHTGFSELTETKAHDKTSWVLGGFCP